MLRLAIGDHANFSLAASDQGLFIDLARDAQRDYDAELFLLCGRDAAERIVGWDYGDRDGIHQQLREFQLLVASRGGGFTPSKEIEERVSAIGLSLDETSSSEVRRRVESGENWRELVPGSIVPFMESRLELWGGHKGI